MAELIVYASASDGNIASNSTSYGAARVGYDLSHSTGGGSLYVGQAHEGISGQYSCYLSYLAYDTTTLYGGTVTAVAEYLYLASDATQTNYTEEVRSYDWGDALTTADWISGANLGNYTLLSSRAVSPSAGYNEFSSSANFIAAVNVTGVTKLIHNSDRHRLGNTPGNNQSEYVSWYSADNSGTTQDPKLVITYTPAPAIITFDGEGDISVTGDTYIPILFAAEPSSQSRSPIATHITVTSPTHSYTAHITPEPAESTRVERMVSIDAGDATVCQAVADKLIERWGREQLSISGVISLETRLDFDTKVRVVIPRAGINGKYPVQRREHDVFARTTTLSMGDILLDDNELIARLLQDLINK